MSHVYMVGDLHFGHAGITQFRTQFPSEEVHRHYLRDCWNDVITKNDVVYVLGDAAFTLEGLQTYREMKGRKILVRGNHDTLSTLDYLTVFEEVEGAVDYKGFWLTHIPIHPGELYRRPNIHGHCHRGGPDTGMYFNACIDFLDNWRPIKFSDIILKLSLRDQEDVSEKTKALLKRLKEKYRITNGKYSKSGTPDNSGGAGGSTDSGETKGTTS